MKRNRFGQGEVLTSEQQVQLFAEGLLTARDRALFGLCLFAACRISEACNFLTDDALTFEGNARGWLLFRKYNTKGKQDSREVPAHPRLQQYLLEYVPNLKKEFLFPGRHGLGHLHKASADRIFRDACKRVRIEGVSTHSLRRTALTEMHNSGVPLRRIQKISGHRTLAALSEYLDVSKRELEDAIANLGDWT